MILLAIVRLLVRGRWDYEHEQARGTNLWLARRRRLTGDRGVYFSDGGHQHVVLVIISTTRSFHHRGTETGEDQEIERKVVDLAVSRLGRALFRQAVFSVSSVLHGS